MDFSLVTSAFETLHIAPPSRLVLLEARTLSSAHVPSYPPDMPALLAGIDSHELVLHLKTVLLTTYPSDHLVHWVGEGKMKEENMAELNGEGFSENLCLYVPALGEGTSIESFAEIVAHLRAPEDVHGTGSRRTKL